MPLPEGFSPIDFLKFHREELPRLMAEGRERVAAQATAGLRPLALRVPGAAAYTYAPRNGSVDLIAGEDAAATLIELDVDAWQGLVHELEAPAGLLYAQRARCVRGAAIDLMVWESALRALYSGRPPYDPGRQPLRDRRGAALAPEATFAPASDPEEMTHFLRTAGYLFLRDVFREGEVAALREEAAQLQRDARPGDKLSWWGKNAAGEEVLCRVTRGISQPRLAALLLDARVHQFTALADETLVYKKGEGEGVTVIYKRPGMTEGLGDLPWHRDCGMGGHAVMCPTLVVSIYLTAATPETGELMMLPGSHCAAVNAHDRRLDLAAHAAHFRARPGDVSLHYSDTVHAAPPPTDPARDGYRISAVLSFARPDARHHRGEASYNDVLHQRADGQIEHLETVAKRL